MMGLNLPFQPLTFLTLMMPSVFLFLMLSRLRTACEPQFSQRSKETGVADDAIRCDACPVLCYIKPGRTGSCDRYGNDNGQLVRLDPHVMLEQAQSRGDSLVPFLGKSREWD